MKKKDIIGENSGPKKFYHWMHSCGMPICYALIWLIGAVVGKHYPDYNSLVLFFVLLLELVGVLLDIFIETKELDSLISYVLPDFILYACGIIGLIAILLCSLLFFELGFNYVVILGLVLVKFAQGWLSNNVEYYIVRIEKSSLKPSLKAINKL